MGWIGYVTVASTKREISLKRQYNSGRPTLGSSTCVHGMNENFTALRRDIAALRHDMNENNTAIQLIENDVNIIRNDVNGIRNDLNLLSIQTLRNTNRNLLGTTVEMIVPIPNQQGQPPPLDVFPRFQTEIAAMEEPDVNILLNFYGILPTTRRDTLHTKKVLLCRHLGLIFM